MKADWPWASPDATRAGIQDRIRSRYPMAERQLRLYEVAFRRLLARLEAQAPGRWVLKGGVALLLRLDPNRTSKDLDLSFVDPLGTAKKALDALAEAAALDLEDFFSFEIASRADVETVGGESTLPVQVDARIGGRTWVLFEIDLGWTAVAFSTEPLAVRDNLTGLTAVDALPELQTIPMALQVAQKTCAMFELHGNPPKHSSRARDLVDIAMIAAQVDGISADELIGYLASEATRRLAIGSLHAPLPKAFALTDNQVVDWRRRWRKATREAAMSFDEAFATAVRFLAAILAGSANGHWSAETQTWDEQTHGEI